MIGFLEMGGGLRMNIRWKLTNFTLGTSHYKKKIVEDKIVYDKTEKKVKVSYPWTQEVFNLSDNLWQAAKVQGSVERRLLKN